jgi:hypothetical protein
VPREIGDRQVEEVPHVDVEVEMVVDRGHDGVVEDVADGVGELGRVVAQTVGVEQARAGIDCRVEAGMTSRVPRRRRAGQRGHDLRLEYWASDHRIDLEARIDVGTVARRLVTTKRLAPGERPPWLNR